MELTPTKVSSALVDELRRPGGLALAFAGIALTMVAYFVLPDWKIPAQALAAVIVVALAFACISVAALSAALQRASKLQGELSAALAGNRYAPKVIQAMADPIDDKSAILLLEPNRLFGQAMLVSIYYEDERNFELLVGSGQVSNVQTNGLIQISVTDWEEPYIDIKRGILAQQMAKIDRLLVRPAPTTQFQPEFNSNQFIVVESLEDLNEGRKNDKDR